MQYSICGHGDNIFLLKKHVVNFSENAYYICQIDPTGNEVKPFREIDPDLNTDFVYYGEGVFKSDNSSHSGGDRGFYNATTNNSFNEGDRSKFLSSFENGKALFLEGNVPIFDAVVYVYADTFSSADSYLKWRESLTEKDLVPDTKPEIHYPEKIQIIECGSISGDYYPLFLKGADENYYFTILSAEGVEQYTPVKLFDNIPRLSSGQVSWDSVFFYEGYYAYVHSGNMESSVILIKPDGQTETYSGYKITGLDKGYLLTDKNIVNLETGNEINKINEY